MAQRINILRPEPDSGARSYRPAPGPEAEALSPKRLLASLFRARRFLFLLFVIGAIVGIFMGISQPNLYRSEGTFIVKGSGGENLNLNPLADSEDPFQKFQVRGNAPAILESETVLRAVAEALGPEIILAPYKPVYVAETSIFRKVKNWILRLQAWLHSGEEIQYTLDKAIIRLKENLRILARGRNDLLTVTYTANEPERAQRILQTYMSVAREVHLEIYNEAQNSQLIQSNLEEARRKLTKARGRLDGLLSGLGARDFDSEYEELQERHRVAESELRRLERQIKMDEHQLQELKALQKTAKPDITKEVEIVEVDPQVPILEEDVATKTKEIEELLVKYKPSDPQIRALQKIVEKRRKKLEELRSLPPKKHVEYRILPNPEYQANRDNIRRLESDLRLNKTEITSARTMEGSLKRDLGRMREQLPRYRELKAALVRAQAEFDDASRKADLADKRERLTSKSLSSLATVSPASLPLTKTGPRRGRILILSILGFVGAGFLLVILLALSDKTVRSPEDLESVLGIQTLAIIPQLDRKNIRRHKQLRASGWN